MLIFVFFIFDIGLVLREEEIFESAVGKIIYENVVHGCTARSTKKLLKIK